MKKTQLYKDALIEARELKELAEKRVKTQLMEELSPIIKQQLSVQLSNLLNEQEEEMGVTETDDAVAPAGMPITASTQSLEVADEIKPVDAPEPGTDTVDGSDVGTGLDIPLPGADGMITVSVEDLFNKPEEVMQAVDKMGATDAVEPPADVTPPVDTGLTGPSDELPPAPAGDEMPLMESPRVRFLQVLDHLSEQEKSLTSETIKESDVVKFELSLIALVESGQNLVEKQIIESSDLSLCKKRAVIMKKSLQEKMNTAFKANSYNQSNQEKHGEPMATKQSLKSLFEETEQAFDDFDTDSARKELESKQKKLEGQDKGTEDIGEKSQDGDWSEEGAKEAGKDSDSKSALDEAMELFMAAMALNENEDEISDGGDMPMDAPSVDVAVSAPVGAEPGADEDFDIESLLQDFEAQLKDHGVDIQDFDLDVSGAGKEGGEDFDLHFGLDDEGKISDVDAAPGMPGDKPAMDMGAEGEDAIIAEAAATIRKARMALAESKKEQASLELYNSKTAHLNKLMISETIVGKKEIKAAISALDRAGSLQEVEAIYKNIISHKKTKLQENKVARNSKAAVVAENSNVISEGVKPGNQSDESPFITRLQELAKMK